MGWTGSSSEIWPRLIPGLVLVGFSAAVAGIALNGAAGLEVPSAHKATAYGIHETSTHLSAAFAITALSAISLWGRESASLPDETIDGFRLALWAAAAVVAAVAAVVCLRGRAAPRWSGS